MCRGLVERASLRKCWLSKDMKEESEPMTIIGRALDVAAAGAKAPRQRCTRSAREVRGPLQ